MFNIFMQLYSYIMGTIELEKLKQLPCTDQQLNTLKTKYEDIINSSRTFSKIKSFVALLNVLDKRDHLDTKVIAEISGILEIQIRNLLGRNVTHNAILGINETAGGQLLNSNNLDHLQKIYKCIYDHLGTHWKEFARYLGIPEGQIDNLTAKNNTLQSIEYILNYHEENCSSETWRQDMLTALEKSRRKDLSIKVEKMLDRYKITRPIHR